MNKLIAAGVLALASQGAQAQSAPPPACQDAAYRQFDFWVGQWDVFNPAGKKAGESLIELHGNGCFILEHWTGAGGSTGKSLNSYDAADKQWHQYWVDNSGSRLNLSGRFADGKMILEANGQRITWTPLADGSVRQHWESSTDAGKTWTTAFDGKYVKRK